MSNTEIKRILDHDSYKNLVRVDYCEHYWDFCQEEVAENNRSEIVRIFHYTCSDCGTTNIQVNYVYQRSEFE